MLKKIILLSIIVIVLSIFVNFVLKFNESKNSGDAKQLKSRQLFKTEELKLFNGVDKEEIYLSILGLVFDVSKAKDRYGPGGNYNFFAAKDASRSFVTGKFTESDLSDEVNDLSQDDLSSLNYWVQFYKKEYKSVGKLIGRYYNENGELTSYGKITKQIIAKAEESKKNDELLEKKFPSCNIEWDANKGSRVWCSKRSGGVERDWAGFPRQLYQPGSQDPRCVCVSEFNENLGTLQEYEDCDKNSQSCYIKNI